MFDFLKQKAVVAAAKKPNGVFATDFLPALVSPTFREEIIAKAIQRIVTPVGAKNGGRVGTDTKALDTLVKNSTFAGQYGIPDAQLGFFGSQSFIGYQLCAIISQNWLIDKCNTMPADDAVRTGFEITVNDGTKVEPKLLDAMRTVDAKMNLTASMREYVRMGRMFGIRVAMFRVETPDPVKYYGSPFNPDGIQPHSYKGIVQIDPYWIVPQLDTDASANPASGHFYEPTWWIINGMKIHRTHLVIYIPSPVADVLKPTYYFGGVPYPQKVAERVYGAERTANEGPLLALSKRTTVIHVDIEQAIANEVKFGERMEKWVALVNNFGVKVVGTDEKIEQFDTALADLDVTIMTQFQLVAAAAGVPATKLMGTQPKGFNTTGEFEAKSYQETLKSIQTNGLQPLIERHHLMVMRSEIVPVFELPKPITTGITWEPLDVPTAKDISETNRNNAQSDLFLIQGGGISGEDSRNRLINDVNSGYNGLTEALPEEPDENDIEAMAGAAPAEGAAEIRDPRAKPDAPEPGGIKPPAGTNPAAGDKRGTKDKKAKVIARKNRD